MMIPVCNGQLSIVDGQLNRCIYFLYFPIFRSRLTITHQQTVKAESFQIRLITEVSAVRHHNAAIRQFFINSLIYPVPDETAQHTGIAIYFIPIFFKVAQRISHRMGIFACHHRTVVIGTFRYFQQPFPTCIFRTFFVFSFCNARIQVFLFHTGIKTADHIDCLRIRIAIYSLRTFIMNGACRIKIV